MEELASKGKPGSMKCTDGLANKGVECIEVEND